MEKKQVQIQQNENNGGWIQTFSNKRCSPLHPLPDMFDIESTAHALSNKCRFSGHTKKFYCPTEEQRILTSDLHWVPAGDLQVGDGLVGFDETPWEKGAANNKRRRYRNSEVLVVQPQKLDVVRLEMEDGSTVRCSLEHPWLVATKQSRNQKWLSTDTIIEDMKSGRKRYMHRFLQTWERLNTFEGGWLSGILDGEGYLSIENRRGVQMGVAQNPGLVLEQIKTLYKQYGFLPKMQKIGIAKVQNVQFGGGWRETARLLGMLQPIRLIEKFQSSLLNGSFKKQMDGLGPPILIKKYYKEGKDWCVGLETSTHTYLCEGFGAHNSVAQHSVLVSIYCNPDDAKWGLLHDASEAYLIDLPTPLKVLPEFATFKTAEEKLQKMLYEMFGLFGSEPPSIYDADKTLLVTEKRDLMPPHNDWQKMYPQKPLSFTIIPMNPDVAEQYFLTRFKELFD